MAVRPQSGPITLALGQWRFRALGFGFASVKRSLDTKWASVAVADGFDRLQWTGARSETLSIIGAHFPKELGGEATFEGLRADSFAGVSMLLLQPGGRVMGRYAIQKIDDDRTEIDLSGRPAKVAYTIELINQRRIMTSAEMSAIDSNS